MRRPSLQLRPPRVSRRAAAGLLVALAALIPGWLWLRDSSLVRVKDVEVRGLSGPQAAQIRQAIVDAGREMTTLHLRRGVLDEALRPFPAVAGVALHPSLPNRLEVDVRQRLAVGALAVGQRRVAVAADGTVLDGAPTQGLALVAVAARPGGRMLTDRRALALVRMLGAAPAPLRERVERAALGPRGVTAQLRDGPTLYFGPGTRLRAKWVAAVRVLSDITARGASYLDLRVPERPAAGGLEPVATPAGPAATAASPSPVTAATTAPTPATAATNPQVQPQPSG